MYGNVSTLREMAQVTPNDLFLSPRLEQGATKEEREEARFVEVLTERLEAASELVNIHRKRDFDAEKRTTGRPIPLLVVDCAYRIAGNMIEHMIDQQNSKRLKRDDGQADLGFPSTNFIDSGIHNDLMLLDLGTELPHTTHPRFSRVRSLAEIESATDPVSL